jgi:F-type H+-transporting ATPase subunit gamma
MCAQFTDHIAEHAAGVASEYSTEPTVVAVGARVQPKLQDYGVRVSDQVEMYGSIEELPTVVRACILKIDQLQRSGIGRVVICYNQESESSYKPHHETLVPVDTDWLAGLRRSGWPTSQIPAVLGSVPESLSHVLREHLFSRLYRAAAESLAAENTTRLSAMQSAEDNLDERLNDLRTRYNRQRQQDITSELLDIVGGYTALEQ